MKKDRREYYKQYYAQRKQVQHVESCVKSVETRLTHVEKCVNPVSTPVTHVENVENLIDKYASTIQQAAFNKLTGVQTSGKKCVKVFELCVLFIISGMACWLSVDALTKFCNGSAMSWAMFISLEGAALYMAITLNRKHGKAKIVQLIAIIVISITTTLVTAKKSWDDVSARGIKKDIISKEISNIEHSIDQLNSTIKALQDKEMYSKAIPLIEQKNKLIESVKSLRVELGTEINSSDNLSKYITAFMRLLLSLILIGVNSRIGDIAREII